MMGQDAINVYVSLYYAFKSHLAVLALAWLRLAPMFFFLPFLNSKLLNGSIAKNCVIIFILIGIAPLLRFDDELWQERSVIELMLYEVTIGLILALVLAMPFLIANIIGELIDNQRGATISDTIDPANGIESSEMSILVSHIICMIFLAQGGLYQIAQIIADSYRALPMGQGFDMFNSLPIGEWLNTLIKKSLILTSPILITLFISEVALGLYSRFCPQLNAFSLSLSIKSIIAFTVFMLYFHVGVPDVVLDVIEPTILIDIFK